MAPILIDKRHLLTAIVLFLLTVLACLTVGYILGYQAAVKANISSSLVSELKIPAAKPHEKKNPLAISAYAAEPGEDVDVDRPDDIIEVETSATADIDADVIIASLAELEIDAITSHLEIVDTANSTDARYTIQVGLYGNKNNADRKVDELLNKQLSA